MGRKRSRTCRRDDANWPIDGRSELEVLADLTLGRSIPVTRDATPATSCTTPIRKNSCPLGAHIRRANPRTGDARWQQGPLDNFL